MRIERTLCLIGELLLACRHFSERLNVERMAPDISEERMRKSRSTEEQMVKALRETDMQLTQRLP